MNDLSIEAVLERSFGLTGFRPGQREVVTHLLGGRSAAAVFPTGGGKSLCYQLPALMLPGVALVVSPLIALMKDQIDALAGRGIAASRLDSTLTPDEHRAVMDGLRAGTLKLLYVAPERFNNERFRAAVRGARISLFAVDEAHCISEWGHNFRPDYLKLAEFARLCGVERRLALTATATPPVLDDICRLLEIAPECAVRTGFYRPNLTVNVRAVEENGREDELLGCLRERPPGPTIVYVTQQRTAVALAETITRAGHEARPYHAGFDADRRTGTQEWFMASDRAVVVATIAFGMGIDKADIRYVYHYNPPKSLENFSQEIGRAGRDGEPAVCETLLCPSDLNVLENFAYGDTPGPAAVAGLIREVLAAGDRVDVALQELANRHDIRPLVVRTILTYLELDGWLEGGTPHYETYQFRALEPERSILARFEGERRDFLAVLFDTAVAARKWSRVDPTAVASATASDRARVVRALDYLAESGLLEVRAAGVRHRFRRLAQPGDLARVAAAVQSRLEARELAEVERLQRVVELAARDGCTVAALAAHFGESLERDCGHCSWCTGGKRSPAPIVRPAAPVDGAVLAEALALRDDRPEALGEPRALARFLCGVTSPRLTRAKLTAHRLFGAMQHVPFPDVLSSCAGRAGDRQRGSTAPCEEGGFIT